MNGLRLGVHLVRWDWSRLECPEGCLNPKPLPLKRKLVELETSLFETRISYIGESKPCNCCQSNTCIWYQCQPCQICFPFRYDVGGLCNGILAGVVSITAGCSNITNLSAIGVAVARLLHSFFLLSRVPVT